MNQVPSSGSKSIPSMLSSRIMSCRVEDAPHHDSEGNRRIMARVEGVDGEHSVFSFFDDEHTFNAEELVGITVSQARTLKQRRPAE